MLFTGLLVTSCHDEDMISNYSGVSQKTEAYDQAFKKAFGTPAANHHWGFSTGSTSIASTRAFTRGANKNSNQWASEGWIVPDPLTEAQKDKVRRFFQQNKNPKGISVNYENFFVQQVYKGGTKPDGSLTAEVYEAGNGDAVTGSNQMDKLTAGSSAEHINDFNYGDRGEINVQNNSKNGEHSDAITLMVNSKTDCFGFHNSLDSKQYDDKYVIIRGSDIDAWDSSEPSVTGMFFVGFDYEANKAAYDYNGSLSYNTNQYLVTETSSNKGVTIPNRDNGKKYLIGGADGYYSDWIVRITKGVKTTDGSIDTGEQFKDEAGLDQYWRKTTWEAIESGRVFCEDLGGNYSTTMDDFDFNDIVFDAVIWKTQDFFYQEVKIQDVWEEGTPLAGQLKYEQRTDEYGNLLYLQATDENGNLVFDEVPRLDGQGQQLKDENGNLLFDYIPVYTDIPDCDETKPVWKVDENGEYLHESKELEDYRSSPKYQAEIALLATGATIGAAVEDTEVHDAFGVGITNMVNTVGSSASVNGIYYDKDPVYLGKYDINSTSVNDIPITVLWGTQYEGGASTLRSGNEYNGAPQKFQVPIGTPWMQERFGISSGYPAFTDWVQNENANWLNPSDESKQRNPLYLYEQTWPSILSTTNYEDRKNITKEELGFTGSPSKGSSSSNSGNHLITSGGASIWSATSYTSQAKIEPSQLTSLDTSKGATLIVKGTHAAYWWAAKAIFGNSWGAIISADPYNNSYYGQLDDLTTEGPITVSLPLSSSDVAKIAEEGLRVEYTSITISKIELVQ